jgi:hypothetical protein
MAGIVYILCALTSISCAVLLLNAYRKNGLRLLFWCAVGFVGFATNNSLLFIDLVLLPQKDLILMRTIPALVGMMVMIYGFIIEEI